MTNKLTIPENTILINILNVLYQIETPLCYTEIISLTKYSYRPISNRLLDKKMKKYIGSQDDSQKKLFWLKDKNRNQIKSYLKKNQKFVDKEIEERIKDFQG